MDNLTLKAFRSYRKGCEGSNEICQQPDGDTSGAQKIGSRDYVILRNARGVFAVFGLAGGQLKRINPGYWPVGLN